MTAAARVRSAAATARSAPGSTSSEASASLAPSSASARAAGGGLPARRGLARARGPLAHERRAFGEGGALTLGCPRAFGRSCCLELETRELGLRFGLVRGRRLRAEPLDERRGGLHPQLEPLDAALQPIARRHRRLATAGGVRELLLRARTVAEHSFEPPLRASFRERHGVAALLRLGATRARLGQIELCDSRAQTRDLAAELLGALRGRRLERKRPQALAHLLLDVARALDLQRDARELQLGAMPAALELPESSRLLDERAPILRLRRENLLDLALADDRVHGRAEPHVREDLDEVRTPNRSAVDEVLALGAAHEPSRDRDLGEVEIGPRAVLVVEDELDLAVLCSLPVAAACEEHVVGLLGAQLGRRERAGGPDDGVGDVRLAGAVRPDDDGNAGLERDLERVGERLEAADAKRAQVHRGRILTTAPDSETRRGGQEGPTSAARLLASATLRRRAATSRSPSRSSSRWSAARSS